MTTLEAVKEVEKQEVEKQEAVKEKTIIKDGMDLLLFVCLHCDDVKITGTLNSVEVEVEVYGHSYVEECDFSYQLNDKEFATIPHLSIITEVAENIDKYSKEIASAHTRNLSGLIETVISNCDEYPDPCDNLRVHAYADEVELDSDIDFDPTLFGIPPK
jgi:hypothetical protein